MEKKLFIELKKIKPCRVFREIESSGIFSGSFISGKSLRRKAEKILFEDFVILYLLKGEGRYIDFLGREHKLFPGTLALRVPNAPHSIYRYQKSEWLEFAMRLPEALYELLLKFRFIDKTLTFSEPGLNICIMRKLNNFMEYLNNHEDTGIAMAKSLELLLVLCKDKKNKKPEWSSDIVSEETKIEKACLILEKDFSQKINAKQIAELIEMGYESFRKKFTEMKGTSPINYRINMKMENARLLLSEPELQIKEISNILGYADVSDFSRQFKKYTGTSPLCFRKN